MFTDYRRQLQSHIDRVNAGERDGWKPRESRESWKETTLRLICMLLFVLSFSALVILASSEVLYDPQTGVYWLEIH